MKEVLEAMLVMGISTREQSEIMAIAASVLHLGNIGITEEEGLAVLTNTTHAKTAAMV
jgi:myosin-1